MKKLGSIILLGLFSLSAEASQCVTCPLGPNGSNQWRLIYQVGQCVNSGADIICSKIDNIGSVMDGCNNCSAFDVVTSELNVIESKIDFISVSLFDSIFELATAIESVMEQIWDTVTLIDSLSDVLMSKIEILVSEIDICNPCSVFSSISTKIDTLTTDVSVCCNTLSIFDVIIKSDIDSVSTKVDGVNAQVTACCNTLSVLDTILKSDIDSVSTKVDSVGSQVSLLKSDLDACCSTIESTIASSNNSLLTVLKSDLDACCNSLSVLDTILKSDIDSVSTKVDGVNAQVTACCSTLSVLDTILKSDIDSVSTKVDGVSAQVTALSVQDVILMSDIDSVSTKVDSVSSQIDTLSSKADACCSLLDSDLRSIGDVLTTSGDACCATLSAFDVILKSDIDSVSTKIDGVNAQVTACCNTLSVLDTILKSDIDSVSTKVDGVNAQVTACCALLSAQDSILKSDIDSVSTKVDSVSSQVSLLKSDLDACCSTIESTVASSNNSLLTVLKSDLDACCSNLSVLDTILKSDIDSVSTKVDGVNAQVTACCNTLSILDTILKSDIDSVSTKVDGVNAQVTACCALLSSLDVILKSDIDSVSTKVDGVNTQVTACCALLSTLDTIIKSDIDSVSTKVDGVNAQVTACCSTLSVLDTILKSDLDACCSALSSKISALDTNNGQNITFMGDVVSEARDDHLAEQWIYGLNLSFTTIIASGSNLRNTWTIAGSGSIASATSMITAATGITTASSASVQSKRYIRYQPGRECYALFTGLFSTPATGANQWIGCFDAIDGFAVGYNGTTFSILYRSSITGSAVNTFIPQSSFNVDQLNGSGPSGITLNPQTLNIFRIQYSWFGAAPIQFSIMSNTGQFQVFHIIEFPNSVANPHLLLPQLPMRIEADNNATTSNVSVSNACWAAGVIADPRVPANGRIFTVSNTVTTVTTTETNVLTIQNPATINGTTNKIEAKISIFGGGTTSSSAESNYMRLVKNATVTGTAFTAVNAGNSIMNVSITGIYTANTGTLLLSNPSTSFGNGPFVNYFDDKENVIDIYILPGETITLTAQGASGTVANVIGILGWDERY